MKQTIKDVGDLVFDLVFHLIIIFLALNIIGSILITNALGAEQPLTKDEEIVALTLMGEARGEGWRGLYAVACVIQKRAEERKLTPAQVCLQPKQFSCWKNKISIATCKNLLKTNKEKAKYAKLLARSICKGWKLVQAFTGEANHYHANYVKPYWIKGKKPTKIIGNHIFYKLP